jgi:hypothetical protein
MQIPELRMKAELVNIAGAREPALRSQTALNIVLSRPLRGSSSAATALRTVARTTVRSTAATTSGPIPISVSRYMGNNLSVWSFSLKYDRLKTPACAGVFLCSQSWHHQPLKKQCHSERSVGIHNNNVRSGTTVMDCHANCVCSQ